MKWDSSYINYNNPLSPPQNDVDLRPAQDRQKIVKIDNFMDFNMVLPVLNVAYRRKSYILQI